jgi:GT2 family glycosyltransferase
MTDNERVWSRGGVLTKHLRMPKHVLEIDHTGAREARAVDWLDGACVMYRAEALRQNPFREDFFLYFEETELHTRLRRAGWDVLTAPGATAHQSSDGMPAFWGSRNFVLFQRAHGSRTSQLVAPAYFALRSMAASAVGGRWSEVRAAPRGLLAGYRARSTGTA